MVACIRKDLLLPVMIQEIMQTSLHILVKKRIKLAIEIALISHKFNSLNDKGSKLEKRHFQFELKVEQGHLIGPTSILNKTYI